MTTIRLVFVTISSAIVLAGYPSFASAQTHAAEASKSERQHGSPLKRRIDHASAMRADAPRPGPINLSRRLQNNARTDTHIRPETGVNSSPLLLGNARHRGVNAAVVGGPAFAKSRDVAVLDGGRMSRKP
jgi:hypothetical protein